MSNILNMSIEEMHASLKEKKIKPSDLVKASIEKAKENQETYNAFVTILEEALELSYELDNNFDKLIRKCPTDLRPGLFQALAEAGIEFPDTENGTLYFI